MILLPNIPILNIDGALVADQMDLDRPNRTLWVREVTEQDCFWALVEKERTVRTLPWCSFRLTPAGLTADYI